jgi:hypothetical protein
MLISYLCLTSACDSCLVIIHHIAIDAVKTLVLNTMDSCPQSMAEFQSVAASQADDAGHIFECAY